MILVGYGFFKALLLVRQSQPEASTTSLIQDFQQAGMFRPQDYSFDLAFTLSKELDPSFGKIQVNWVNYYQNSHILPDGLRKREKKIIPINIRKYYKDTSKESHVKFFIDDSFFLELRSDSSKKTNFYIQRNEAIYQDDYIQFGQDRRENFFAVTNINRYDDNYTPYQGHLAAVFIRFDNRYEIYTIKNYSLFDWLGEIGGLYGSLTAIGFCIVRIFCQKMFMSDIMKQIYQIRKDPSKDNSYEEQKQESIEKVQQQFPQNQKKSRNKNQLRDGLMQELSQKSTAGLVQDDPKTAYENFGFDNESLHSFSQFELGNKLNDHSRIHTTQETDQQNFLISFEGEDSNFSKISDFKLLNQKYQQSSINQTSQIRKDQEVKIKTKQKVKNQQQPLNKERDPHIQQNKDLGMQQKIKENCLGIALQAKDKLNDQDIDNLLSSFTNRIRFNYGTKKVLDYIFKCFCLRKNSNIKQYNYSHHIFLKGQKKLEQELDVIQLLKNMRKFKLIQN
eukprot:403355969